LPKLPKIAEIETHIFAGTSFQLSILAIFYDLPILP